MDASVATQSLPGRDAPSRRLPVQPLAQDRGAGQPEAAAPSGLQTTAGKRGPWLRLRRALLGPGEDPRDL
jgi:hypothetical protein